MSSLGNSIEASDTFPRSRSAMCVVSMLIVLLSTSTTVAKDFMKWEKLPDFPDPIGVAAPFAGVSGNALIVAGGANFPNGMPWEGGKKVWHDAIHVLPNPAGPWKSGFKLPQPNAYGISITTKDGLVCIGGGDATRHYTNVFLLKWANEKIVTEMFASLPRPAAFGSGAMLGNVIYVAGGIETPDATSTLKTFLALDLSKPSPAWKELEPCPGPGRMLAVAAAQDGAFYIAGGTDLTAGEDGKPQRKFLRDGYRYTPGKGWKRIADLPRIAVAAPSPAPAIGQSQWLVIGGDDASQIKTPPTEHRGFPREVLVYDAKTDSWKAAGDVPFSLVTTPTVIWNNRVVIPGGEARPGVRSPEIWAAPLK